MVVVLTGVSGTDRTTIGRIVAEHLRCRVLDADNYHPAANVAKMPAGIALEEDVEALVETWIDVLARALGASSPRR